MENLNAQTNLNNQLKTQYSNLLRINSSLEKTSDDLREKNNNLLIQKDLLQNEFHSLRNSYENEKNAGVCLVNRINELEATVQLLNAENGRLKDRESYGMSEMAKMESLLNQLRKVSKNT